jgi:hypothetical protein
MAARMSKARLLSRHRLVVLEQEPLRRNEPERAEREGVFARRRCLRTSRIRIAILIRDTFLLA